LSSLTNLFTSDWESNAVSCFGSFVTDILAPIKIGVQYIVSRKNFLFIYAPSFYVDTFKVFLRRTSLTAHMRSSNQEVEFLKMYRVKSGQYNQTLHTLYSSHDTVEDDLKYH
jgi:hypothetical protein